jgi:hypothetical protein
MFIGKQTQQNFEYMFVVKHCSPSKISKNGQKPGFFKEKMFVVKHFLLKMFIGKHFKK